MEQDATEPLAAASGSADWRYHSSDGVNMWTWKPELGATYMVTQHGDNIQAHLTTGTRYKYCRTIRCSESCFALGFAKCPLVVEAYIFIYHFLPFDQHLR